MKILNKKQIREIANLLKKQFDFNDSLDYVFVKEGKEYFITNRDISNVDFTKLNVKKIGILFGRVINDNFLLSVEGSQIIGPRCRKNILDFDDSEAEDWFKGMNMMTEEDNGIYLVRYGKDFLGSCKVINREIINSLDKNRRVYKLKI